VDNKIIYFLSAALVKINSFFSFTCSPACLVEALGEDGFPCSPPQAAGDLAGENTNLFSVKATDNIWPSITGAKNLRTMQKNYQMSTGANYFIRILL